MKILIVHNAELSHFPPVLNLIQCLSNNNYEVVVLAKDNSNIRKSFSQKTIRFVLLDSSENYGKCKKIYKYIQRKFLIRNKVKELMKECDVIWTTTDGTVRELGRLLFQYKHVMQLMELIEYMPQLPGIPFLSFDIKKFALHAYKVVVPEYNRAHIQKTWWGLDKLPAILPNKPYYLPDETTIPNEMKEIVHQMKEETRKILLYQGVFYEDRNLDIIAKAVEKLSDTYCLYIMGRDTDYSRTLLKKYSNIVKIPFFKPPHHLYITYNAQVGLMPYIAKKTFYFSVLNALYCAPNKIFEYAGCGLPMLGSRVPGIELPFFQYNIGKCYEDNVDSVINCLNYIDVNYSIMRQNCFKYFESIDIDKIVKSIRK